MGAARDDERCCENLYDCVRGSKGGSGRWGLGCPEVSSSSFPPFFAALVGGTLSAQGAGPVFWVHGCVVVCFEVRHVPCVWVVTLSSYWALMLDVETKSSAVDTTRCDDAVWLYVYT